MTELTAKQAHSAFNRAENFEIDLKGVLSLIKHSYNVILIITIVFFVAGIYYAQTRQPVYRSTAMIEVTGGDIANTAGSTGGATSMLLALGATQASSAEVEIVLMQSPYVLGKVVSQLGFDISVSPHYSGFFAEKLARFRHFTGSATVSVLNVPNKFLAKPLILVAQNNNQYSLYTKQGQKILDGIVGQLESVNYFSEPLQIQVKSLNAKPGTKFDVTKQPIPEVANDVAAGLNIREQGDNTGILELSYISGNREQAQQLLNTILSIAVEKNAEEKLQEAAKTLQFISTQLPISKNRLENAQKSFDQYSVQSGVFSTVTEGPMLEDTIKNLKNSLDLLKFKNMAMLQKFTPIHPLVIAITQKENQIREEINKDKIQLQKLPSVGEKEANLKRESKIQSGIYSALVQSAQNMEMLKAGTVSSVRILNSASYPVSRIPVKKVEIVFGSILLGLIVSLGVIFVRHALSPVIEDPDTVERALGVPVSAIIPCSQKQARYNRKARFDKLYASTKSFLLACENPNDISIEAIRSLRTAIQMSLLEAKNNIIAITGCSPSVGKSFISSNLAVLFSDLGKRVLIIDSDIRLGKLSQCFGKIKNPGLSTYLQNEASFDEIIQNVIPEKLDFIATGLYPENPSELLAQKKLSELIQTVKDHYDLVIIDTPPILAVTDPALILRYSSVNLMVLGVAKDQMKSVLHAKNVLEKSGVTLTGVIFNTLKHQRSGFGHHYGYSNYHYTYGK